MSILSGLKIIEIEGIDPGRFASMHLAGLGADIVCVGHPNSPDGGEAVLLRNRGVAE